jgi:tRNA dimethylallyltransferase
VVSSTIIAIIGPTASGKSGLALRLAQKYDGEIIAADSRTIYRGMDIGTAKPTLADQAHVAHHQIDLIDPDQSYSAAQFRSAAEAKIKAIVGRGHLPIVVGGTGLYVYGLLYDYHFPAGANNDLRRELEGLPLSELVDRLRREDPETAEQIDLKNPRRVVRAIETVGQTPQSEMRLKSNILLIGLRPPEEQMNKQIAQRTRAMFEAGLIAEVEVLVAKYGPDLEALRSPGYAEIIDFLAGRVDRQQAEELINLHTRQLVRRQLTWFKRNPEIKWFETPAEAEVAVAAFLEKIA